MASGLSGWRRGQCRRAPSGVRTAAQYIKLERRLVHRMSRPRDAAAVQRLVEVAERLGVRVIAKGVDKVSTMEHLWAAGVQCMQGYVFGSPAPAMAETELEHLARAIQPSPQPDGAGYGAGHAILSAA